MARVRSCHQRLHERRLKKRLPGCGQMTWRGFIRGRGSSKQHPCHQELHDVAREIKGGSQGNVVVKTVVVAHVFGGRLRNVLSLGAAGLTALLPLWLIGRALTSAIPRQRYVFDPVR